MGAEDGAAYAPEGVKDKDLEMAPAEADEGKRQLGEQESSKPIVYELTFAPFPSKKLFARGVGSAVLVFMFGWLYIGVAWNPNANIPRLRVAVLNCDAGVPATVPTAMLPVFLQTGGTLGSLLLAGSIYNASSPASSALRWNTYVCPNLAGSNVTVGCGSAAQAAACRAQLSSDVEQGHYWSAIYLPSGMSMGLLSIFRSANMTRVPITVEHIINSGRNLSTYTFIRSVVNAVMSALSITLGQTVLNSVPVSAIDPAFLLAPVTLQLTDTHPVRFYGQHMATYIICTLMWIGGAFSAGVVRQFRTKAEIAAIRGETVDHKQLLLSLAQKATAALFFSFLHAVALVAILLCLGNWTEDDTYGNQWYFSPGYAIAFTWFLGYSFVSINAVIQGVAGWEKSSFLVTMLLVIQLTSSEGFFAEELSNRFFHVGRALPFRYGVAGLRTVFFGGMTENMTMNWLVPFFWNIGSVILLVAYYLKTYRFYDHAKQAPLESLQALNAFVAGMGGL